VISHNSHVFKEVYSLLSHEAVHVHDDVWK